MIANTKEEVITRGIQAEIILNDGTTLSFFHELGELLKENIVSTAATDWKSRERLYNQFQCINDVLGIMKSYVAAKDTEVELANDDEIRNRD